MRVPEKNPSHNVVELNVERIKTTIGRQKFITDRFSGFEAVNFSRYFFGVRKRPCECVCTIHFSSQWPDGRSNVNACLNNFHKPVSAARHIRRAVAECQRNSRSVRTQRRCLSATRLLVRSPLTDVPRSFLLLAGRRGRTVSTRPLFAISRGVRGARTDGPSEIDVG